MYADRRVTADGVTSVGSTSNSTLTQADENRCGVESDKFTSNPDTELAPEDIWGSPTSRNFTDLVKDDIMGLTANI
jgi:hypothetical protein